MVNLQAVSVEPGRPQEQAYLVADALAHYGQRNVHGELPAGFRRPELGHAPRPVLPAGLCSRKVPDALLGGHSLRVPRPPPQEHLVPLTVLEIYEPSQIRPAAGIDVLKPPG